MFEKIITDLLLGLSLSVDAFAVTIGEGFSCPRRKLQNTLQQSAYFGIFQALMPLIGFYLAGTVSREIMSMGPYISFFLLAFIGVRMLYDTLKGRTDKRKDEEEDYEFSHPKTLMLAFATSIDAFAVGVSFAFTESNVILPCSIIGVTTFMICMLGGLLCSKLPKGSNKGAGIIGGLVLVGIGVKLLIEGLLS